MPELARLLLIAAACLAATGCAYLRGPAGTAPAADPTQTASPEPPATPATPATQATPAIGVLDSHEHRAALIERRQALARTTPDALGAGDVGYYMDVLQARLQRLLGQLGRLQREDQALVLTVAAAQGFEVGSSQPTSEIESLLGPIAGVLAEFGSTLVSVHGHTDATGDPTQNRQLSERRALAVARRLQTGGVARERLLAVGHGPAAPLDSNDTPEGRARNRRIEIRIDPLLP